ncbi:fungal specific transcription factor domain-containing protein [Diplocarpon rosae]|nr:fungal specific transcription factor domain-containing protein [Diplocarpon rosae]
MSTPIAISRTAPIAIALPRPLLEPSPSIESLNSQHLSARARSSASISSTPSVELGSHTRSRRDMPCDACRTRKSRCVINEGQTRCVLCQFHSQDCILVESPQPRKRKLNTEGKEESVAKRRSPDRTEERPRRPTESSASSTGATNSLVEEMANIGGPTLLKRTLGLQNDRYSQYIGPTSDFEPSLIDLSSFDPQDESPLSRGTLRKVSKEDTFLLLPDCHTPGHEHINGDADAIEKIVAPHGPALLELYFRVIHPNFPILQKVVFFEKYHRSYREFSPSILAAVYILAINWWDHSEELVDLPRPDIEELERLARVTLADAMYRPKLSTVQAGLLLSQRPEGDQWAPTAQLVAIGQELGLHLDCTNWKIPPWERGLRKRLAWALYMQDKWGSLVHGRPSHIFASNWAVPALSPGDFPDVEFDESDIEERTEYERGRLLFTHMITLSRILAEVLDTFYTLQAMAAVTQAGPRGTHLVLQLAKPVQLKLKEWFAALPQCLRMDPSAAPVNNKQLISTGSLHLAYFATEITIHRRSGAEGGGNARLTEFAMGMLDTSTGLLKSLPEKPALSRVGSEGEDLGGVQAQSSGAEGYSYGSFSSGGGFGIGAARDGSAGSCSFDRDVDAEPGLVTKSGLESPSTSVSSSEESEADSENCSRPPVGCRTNETD